MSNVFDDMRAAVRQARATFDAADRVADSIADMLVGRLRRVNSSWVLGKLKRELRDYNIHTRKWKD